MTQIGKVNSPTVPLHTWCKLDPAKSKNKTGTPIKVTAVKKKEIQPPMGPNAAVATSW